MSSTVALLFGRRSTANAAAAVSRSSTSIAAISTSMTTLDVGTTSASLTAMSTKRIASEGGRARRSASAMITVNMSDVGRGASIAAALGNFAPPLRRPLLGAFLAAAASSSAASVVVASGSAACCAPICSAPRRCFSAALNAPLRAHVVMMKWCTTASASIPCFSISARNAKACLCAPLREQHLMDSENVTSVRFVPVSIIISFNDTTWSRRSEGERKHAFSIKLNVIVDGLSALSCFSGIVGFIRPRRCS